MQQLVEGIFTLAVLTVCYQFYSYAISQKAEEKQRKCQTLGIVYATIGIVGLTFHTPVVVVASLILLMCGLRLIAHGLDRIDKKIFIDRYDGDNKR